LAENSRSAGYRDEVEIVARLARPLAVLHGAAEQLVNGAYIAALTMPTLWRGEMQIIEGTGHAPQWERPQAFNALLAAFLAESS
jgi:pimeloyl-ACP methyl ester carboxylesterase